MTNASGFAVLPAIDLRAGRVVRLRRGDFAQETAYGDDPVGMALRFASAGARWLHVVDLDAARTGMPSNTTQMAAIVATVGDRVSVEVAGGIRDVAAADGAFGFGAMRIVVGTAALADPSFATQLISLHGAARIVAAIDIRGGRAIGEGWTQDAAGIDAIEAIGRLADAGVTTFEVTAIDRDGVLGGPDLSLYERLVALDRGAILASGGITTVDDLRAVRDLGCAGAIVGSAIYEGSLDLAGALAVEEGPA